MRCYFRGSMVITKMAASRSFFCGIFRHKKSPLNAERAKYIWSHTMSCYTNKSGMQRIIIRLEINATFF